MVNLLGVRPGLDIRNHVNWLHVSSDAESESEFSECDVASPEFFCGSDPGNDFALVRDRPVLSVASRGRSRGRGRRRR
ncbi:hypothetical protein MA16_Dca019616 [Dendrobium catenatum]|uniref:Uncharacterized protein n=1 Tax=Dendrobium catenatum TaxID=906689 RepID=A0A2I0V929_9ASPA|nr:hypothetical protein MA16_Dca019616 [Dendrobium catenatum]